MIENCRIHAIVSLLRATGCTVLSKATLKFFSFSNIMLSGPVVGEPESIKAWLLRHRWKLQATVIISLHLAENFPVEFQVYTY